MLKSCQPNARHRGESIRKTFCTPVRRNTVLSPTPVPWYRRHFAPACPRLPAVRAEYLIKSVSETGYQ
jgi:hypothetical protein